MSSSSPNEPQWLPHAGNTSLDFSTLKDRGAYIVCASRTPVGKYGGCLSSMTAPELGSYIIKESLAHYNINGKEIDELIYGSALPANLGQNPARQVAIGAGIPNSVSCTTVNRVCSSGMKSIHFGAQSIELGHCDVIICGGCESMSNVPYYIENHRFGSKMGHQNIVDGMIKDGLWDVYSNQHMGSCAEQVCIFVCIFVCFINAWNVYS